MKNLMQILLFNGLLVHTIAFNLYNRVDISNKTGAACLDGTDAAFYIWEPDEDEKPVNKVLIYFQQTPFGWCTHEDMPTSLEECFKFITEDSLIDSGSSQNWAGSEMILAGIMSPFDGGEFSMWTKVLMKSCDGGAFMGNRQPITFKRHKLHFKGSLNVIEAFKYLRDKKYLAYRDEVVIAGSMNGAVAALHWAQTLKQYVTASTPIRILADSAIHLNEYNRKNNRTVIENRMRMLNKLFLQDQGPPNKACNTANIDEPWRCLFGIEVQKYLQFPTFYTQSLYDGWSMDYILGFKCAQDFASLSECEEWEREVIQEYHSNVTRVMKEITNKPGYGGFGISCVAHEFTGGRWNNDMFEVPMESTNMVINVVGSWIKSKKTTLFIDSVNWPQNKPCARKVIASHLTK